VKLRFLTPAREELAAVLAHYDDENPERGNRFLDAVEQALEHIREWPQAWQKLSANTRRRLLHRFPYGPSICTHLQRIEGKHKIHPLRVVPAKAGIHTPCCRKLCIAGMTAS